jgi:hypothetical protein
MAYAGLTALVLGLAGLGSRVLFAGPTPEVVGQYGGQFVGGVEVGDRIVVALATGGGTILVGIDPATGQERERVRLSEHSAVSDLGRFDDTLLVRLWGRIPDVPAVEEPWPPIVATTAELWLVVVDGETLEPRVQYRLPPVDRPYYRPMVVRDGWFWLVGLGQGRLDLRSGRFDIRGHFRPAIFGSVDVDVNRDRLVLVHTWSVSTADLDTGEWQHVDHPYLNRYDLPPGASLRYHDSEIWIGGMPGPDWYWYHRYDLATGKTGDERRHVNELATSSFESGGSRWELMRRWRPRLRWASIPPEPGDRWWQVDPATGDRIAEYELGDFAPRFAGGGYLWSTRTLDDNGDGEVDHQDRTFQLARLRHR